jgi:hypothetical protein
VLPAVLTLRPVLPVPLPAVDPDPDPDPAVVVPELDEADAPAVDPEDDAVDDDAVDADDEAEPLVEPDVVGVPPSSNAPMSSAASAGRASLPWCLRYWRSRGNAARSVGSGAAASMSAEAVVR